MKRKILLGIVLCALLLTGCWDRRELVDLGIVEAVGLDEGDSPGEIVMTLEMVRPSSLKTEGGQTQKPPVEIVSAKGRTIAEARQNLTEVTDREPYYSHVKIIVIGEALAKDGINQYLDNFIRSHEVSRTSRVFVAKGVSAAQIFGEEKGLETVQANYLNSMIKNESVNSAASTPTLLDFVIAENNPSKAQIAGAMEIQSQPGMEGLRQSGQAVTGIHLSGTAVFKENRLVGYLDNSETEGLNMVTGKYQSGIINVETSPAKDVASVIVKRMYTSVKPVVSDGKVTMQIHIVQIGHLVEQQGNANISDIQKFNQMRHAEENTVQNDVLSVVRKVQTQYGVDILDFGNTLNRRRPSEWKKMKKQWDTIFPDVSCRVSAEMKLRNTGLLRGPLNFFQ